MKISFQINATASSPDVMNAISITVDGTAYTLKELLPFAKEIKVWNVTGTPATAVVNIDFPFKVQTVTSTDGNIVVSSYQVIADDEQTELSNFVRVTITKFQSNKAYSIPRLTVNAPVAGIILGAKYLNFNLPLAAYAVDMTSTNSATGNLLYVSFDDRELRNVTSIANVVCADINPIAIMTNEQTKAARKQSLSVNYLNNLNSN